MKLKSLYFVICLIPSIATAVPEVVITRSSQTYAVIDDGTVIKSGRVSTGKKGYSTPAGRFTIHSKYRSIRSFKYKVPMVNAMFFRGLKYAMHQGVVPGYPASHGCVRLPKSDAHHLFNLLPVGTTVVIR